MEQELDQQLERLEQENKLLEEEARRLETIERLTQFKKNLRTGGKHGISS